MDKYCLTFTPISLKTASEGDPAPAYGGTVTMRIPTWEDRLGILEVFGATPEEASAFMKDEKNRGSLTKHLASKVPAFFVSSAITRDDGASFTTWEDIQHETELAQTVVPELSWWLLGKHRMAVPSAPS